MSKLFLVNIDLNGNELDNAVIQPLAAAPSNPAPTVGRIYYDTTDGLLKTYDGTSWKAVGSVLSVNNKTGAVVLNLDDIDDGSTYVRSHNDLTNALVSLINGALQKSGGTMSGSIAMGSNKITGLADGSNASDAAAFGQIPLAYASNPEMDGTASAGSSTSWAKGDHVHPSDTSRLAASLKGTANGVAELDSSGKVPSSQLPGFVDDVLEGQYTNSKFYLGTYDSTNNEWTFSSVEDTPEMGKIYVDVISGKTYRWGGTAYAEVSASLALGETSSTAYRGDRGKIAYDHSQDTNSLTSNPHKINKGKIGLSNVDNTSDATKKLQFTGSIDDGNTGFVTGGDAYTALGVIIKRVMGIIPVGSTSVTIDPPADALCVIGTYACDARDLSEVVVDVEYSGGTFSTIFTLAQQAGYQIICYALYATRATILSQENS